MAETTRDEEFDSIMAAGAPVINEAEASSEFDAIMNANVTDENTGEDIPFRASGASPDHPSNNPVVDMVDRVKLSLGDDAGRVNFLKQNYQDAAVNKNGHLVVMHEGKWNYVDPRGQDFTKDPWAATKEVINDSVLDQTNALIIMGTTIGAGAISGGTMTVPGAAGGSFLSTSLGRLVGTYSADPVQQTKDIAFESMFQLVGENFIPGAKKTINAVGDAVEKLGIKTKLEKGARALGRFYSEFNVGQGPMNTIMKHGRAVNSKMKQVSQATGNDTGRYIESLQADNIAQVKTLASKAPKILSNTYNKFQKKIVDAVDKNFKSNISNTAIEGYAKSVQDGVAKVVVGAKTITDQNQVLKILQFAQKSGRMPKGTKVLLKSQAELLNDIKRSGNFDENILKVINDSEAYGLLQKLHKNLDVAMLSKQTTGKAAAKNMMSFKREMGDIIFSLSSKADDLGLNSMRKSFGGYSEIIEQNTKQALDNVGQGQLYSTMNNTWKNLSRELKPLSNAHIRSFKGNGGDAPFETLLNKLKSNPGRNQLTKASLDSIEIAAKDLGDDVSALAIRSTKEAIEINMAAAAFNPYNTGGGMAVGMGAFAVFNMQPSLGVALATASAVKSPRLTKSLVVGSQNIWRGMNQLKSMGPAAVDIMTKDPTASAAFISAITDSSKAQTQMEEQLLSQIVPAAEGEQSGQAVHQATEQVAAASFNDTGAPAADTNDGEKFMQQVRSNTVGEPYKGDLGVFATAAKSESKTDPLSNNLNNLKNDSQGGLSLGLFHMSSKQKTLGEFLNKTGLAEEFKGINPNKDPEAFAARWAEVGQRMGVQKFGNMQKDFMNNDWSSIKVIKTKLKSVGQSLEKLPEEIQELMVSSTIALGGTGAGPVANQLRGARLNTPEGRAKAITDMSIARFARWKKSSTANKNLRGWTNRTIIEQKDLFARTMGREMTGAETNKFLRSMAVGSHKGARDIIKKESR